MFYVESVLFDPVFIVHRINLFLLDKDIREIHRYLLERIERVPYLFKTVVF